MKLHQVKPEEQYRIDLICIRFFGTYSSAIAKKILDANPEIDFTNLVEGTRIKIPERKTLMWGDE